MMVCEMILIGRSLCSARRCSMSGLCIIFLTKGDAFMKSTRFYIKSLIVATLMVAGFVRASEGVTPEALQSLAGSVTEAVQNYMQDFFSREGVTETSRAVAAAVAGSAAHGIIESGQAMTSEAVTGVIDSAVNDALAKVANRAFESGKALTTEEAVNLVLGEASSPSFWRSYVSDPLSAAASCAWQKAKANPITTGLIVGGGILGGYLGNKLYRSYRPTEAQKAASEAQKAFDEIVNNNSLQEVNSLKDLQVFKELVSTGSAAGLTQDQIKVLNEMVKAREIELQMARLVKAVKAKSSPSSEILAQLQRENAELKAMIRSLSEQIQRLQVTKAAKPPRPVVEVVPSPVAPSSVSVQQPAASAQPLTEGELEQIYRRRTTSQAGIQGILKDEGLMARLKVSSGKTAQDILRKIGR
jgi:hypothetical protein